jgi:hypothetical protein
MVGVPSRSQGHESIAKALTPMQQKCLYHVSSARSGTLARRS